MTSGTSPRPPLVILECGPVTVVANHEGAVVAPLFDDDAPDRDYCRLVFQEEFGKRLTAELRSAPVPASGWSWFLVVYTALFAALAYLTFSGNY